MSMRRRPNGGVGVLVIGGGNAALCAAMAARDAGAQVMLLESASLPWRGGNSKYTRNIRVLHQPDAYMPGTYEEAEFLDDLRLVSGDEFDADLALLTIRESRALPAWMEAHGARWQAALGGTLGLSRTNRFFLGGGKALMNSYYHRALAAGVQIVYGARAKALEMDGGSFVAATIAVNGDTVRIEAGAVVVASGGFESNLEWLRRYWGHAVDNFLIRGTAENDGRVLQALLDHGAVERGNPRGFHAVACDARSPRFEGGIITRVDCLPLGIVVNRDAVRFHDEGEDMWPKRYAIWGRLIASQPGQSAFVIIDSQIWGRFIPPVYPPYREDSIEELAQRCGLDPVRLRSTVDTYNQGVSGGRPWDSSRLDGRATAGVDPPKSNWALRIDTPPYYAYPLRPGITFTYLGVGVDASARVLRSDGTAFANVFAAGEIMAGNILRQGYLAGFGMTIGTVFGRIAGMEAAARVDTG
jgi:tricarballylate dehydrogenase